MLPFFAIYKYLCPFFLSSRDTEKDPLSLLTRTIDAFNRSFSPDPVLSSLRVVHGEQALHRLGGVLKVVAEAIGMFCEFLLK